ncbi:MAG: ThuA domain-containing protein [Gemmataceae bacterium]
MMMLRTLLTLGFAWLLASSGSAADPWLSIPGGEGPGKGKHVVLISGDEEYRSEEALPMLAKILAKHHGFQCTVLFAIDPKDGTINPKINNNIPGMDAVKSADLVVIFTRFRNLPEKQMKPFDDYLKAGKPIIGLRTSTHAFNFAKGSPYIEKYQFNNAKGGFGRVVLGETWINHHGHHGVEGTRGIIVKGQENHPILKGIKSGELFGKTDVYEAKLPMSKDCQPLVLGEVTKTLQADSPAVEGKKNNPMMPVCWTKTYTWGGPEGKSFTSTLASSQDFENEPLRHLFVNACYWCLGMDKQIPEKCDVTIVGEYKPSPFKFDGHKRNVKPEDLK